MKKTISILILTCLVCQCMVQLGIMGWYEMNKSYVASTFCENKDNPASRCQGKCYLKKKIQETEDMKSHQAPGSTQESLAWTIFLIPCLWQPETRFLAGDLPAHNTGYIAPDGIILHQDIFRPPPFRL